MEGPNLSFSDRELLLFAESERLKTFTGWPNDVSWTCTPKKLASAGFYFNPSPESPDNVCCMFCQKELDGWESEDDPLAEHKKHSPNCPFLSVTKPIEKLTIVEFIRLIVKVTTLKSDRMIDLRKRQYEDLSIVTRKIINDHIS